MHHPKKKQMIQRKNEEEADGDFLASFDDLSVDDLANIFKYLLPDAIMLLRRVSKQCREGAKKTIVPIDSVRKYNALRVMTRALPNLQQIRLWDFSYTFNKYIDGGDPDEKRVAETAWYASHDIGIICNFRKLRILEICTQDKINGRYDILFRSFPLLQKLCIGYSPYLKLDLEVLAGLPLLKELDLSIIKHLTGNVNCLRILKDTLETVEITHCDKVEGNFMDLADFPHLLDLDLDGTAVKGDIRDIGENDFPSLTYINLPMTVYGGVGYEFPCISDGLDLIRTLHQFKKQRPAISLSVYWYVRLSYDSPDWYWHPDAGWDRVDTPPFFITFVKAGSRVGYRWETERSHVDNYAPDPCEVNWLEPEPDKESSEYRNYIHDLKYIAEPELYKGLYQPPTQEDYLMLIGWESDNENVE
jgi:hypothetical protein